MNGRAFVHLITTLALSASLLVSAPVLAQQVVEEQSSDQIEGFPFPASISGHTRGAMKRYPGTGSAGFGVHYAAKSSGATISIYDWGKDLSSATSADLAEDIASVLKATQTLSNDRGYKASIVDVSVGARVASARASLTFDDNRTEAFFTFITIANGKFVKIQYWTPEQKGADKMAARFRDDYFSRLKSLSRSK